MTSAVRWVYIHKRPSDCKNAALAVEVTEDEIAALRLLPECLVCGDVAAYSVKRIHAVEERGT
jgi:hypothetical protein